MPNGHDPFFKDDPLDPFFAAIERGLAAQFPITGQRLVRIRRGAPIAARDPRRAPFVPNMGRPILDTVTVGRPPAGATPLDLTDPAVDPGNVKLSPEERATRLSRRLFKALQGALDVPTIVEADGVPVVPGLPSHAGVQRRILEGELTAPRDRAERIIDIAAPILASLGVTLPLMFAGGARTAIGAVAGAKGRASIPALLGRVAAPVTRQPGMQRLLGETGVQIFGRQVLRPIGERQLQEQIGSLLFDIGFGGAFGLSEVAGQRQLGEEVSDEELLESVRNLAVGGGLIGTFFRLPTAANLLVAASRLSSAPRPLPTMVRPGTAVGDLVAVETAQGIRWKYKAGVEVGGKKVGGQWVPQDVIEQHAPKIREAELDFIQTLRRMTEATEEGQFAKAAAEQADPQQPATMPGDMAPDDIQAMNTIGALYLQDHAQLHTRFVPKQAIEAEIAELRKQLFDPNLSMAQRVTAGGRIVALETALGQPLSLPGGALPVHMEMAAAELIRRGVPTLGRAGVEQLVARFEARGMPELAGRMKQLLESGVPEALHAEVRQGLRHAERQHSKGFGVGTRALTKEGKVIELLNRPRYGWAYARDLTDPQTLLTVHLDDVLPFPTAGKTVLTKDGRLVQVNTVDEAAGTFGGQDLVSNEVKVRPFSEIAELADSPNVFKEHEYWQEQMTKWLEMGDMLEVPPTDAVTSAGEPVTVVSVGREAVEVVTSKGTRKVMKREDVRRSSKTKPEPESMSTNIEDIKREVLERRDQLARQGARGSRLQGELQERIPALRREIVDYAPGTFPDKIPERHHILYLVVPTDQVSGFEAAYKSAGDLSPHLNLGVHVLPPYPADPSIRLYGLELPARVLPRKLYHDNANLALATIGGKGRIYTHKTPVAVDPNIVLKGRLYRVSEDLHAAAVRSDDALKPMTAKQQQDYLRRLIALHETIDTDVAQAVGVARAKRNEVAEALRERRGQTFLQLEAEAAEAQVDALEKVIQSEVDDWDNWIRELGVPSPRSLEEPAEQAARVQFETEGLTEATRRWWRTQLKKLQGAVEELAPSEELVLTSKVEPGTRGVLARRLAADLQEPELQPVLQEYWELDLMSGDNRVLAHFRLNSLDELEEVIKQQQLTATTLKVFSVDYHQPGNPSRVAYIRPSRGFFEARVESRVLPRGEADLETAIAEDDILLMLGEETRVSGVSVFTEEAVGTFRSFKEADQWIRMRGKFKRSASTPVRRPQDREQFVVAIAQRRAAAEEMATARTLQAKAQAFVERTRRQHGPRSPEFARAVSAAEPFSTRLRVAQEAYNARAQAVQDLLVDVQDATATLSVSEKFAALPSVRELATLPKDRLVDLEDELHNLLNEATARHTRVPLVMRRYAEAFDDVFYDVTGHPSLSAELRDQLGFPYPQDLAPQLRDAHLPGPESIPSGFQISRSGRTLYTPPKPIGPHMKYPSKRPPFVPRGFVHPEQIPAKYGNLHGIRAPATVPELRQAVKFQKQYAEQTRWTEAYVKAQSESGPVVGRFAPQTLNLGRYTPTGQPVEIISPSLTGKDVRVKFFGAGEEVVVPKDKVLPGGRRETSDWELMEAIESGRYAQYIEREPPLGFGSVEKGLGLFGSNDRLLIEEAIADKATELAKGLQIIGNTIVAPKETLNDLFELYRRAQWLDQVETRVISPGVGKPSRQAAKEQVAELKAKGFAVTELSGPTPKFVLTKEHSRISKRVFDAVTAADPQLARPFKFAAYHRTKEKLGGHPFAELQARALSGDLSSEHEAILRAWAAEVGLSSNVPPARIVAALAEHRLLDPHAANVAVWFERDQGFVRWLGDTPPGSLKLKVRRLHDIGGLQAMVGIPWKVLRVHPTTRMLDDLIRSALTEENLALRAAREFWQDIEQHGYSIEDVRAVRQLLQTHELWDDAAAAGASEHLQYAFDRFKWWYEDRLEDVIRFFMKRKIEPIPFDAKNLAMQRFVTKNNLAGNMKDGAFLAVPTPDLWRRHPLGARGEVPRGFTHDQIEAFLTMRRRYVDSSEIPDSEIILWYNRDVPIEDIYRFRRMFDWWKQYGIKNYWPLVHEGNMVILRRLADGSDEVMGWTTSVPDAYDVLEELVAQNRLTVRNGRVIDDIRLEQHSPIIDDIIIRATGDAKEMRAIGLGLAKHYEMGGAELRGFLYRAERDPTPLVRSPGLAHARQRVAGLEPPIIDPRREFMVHSARIARMNYRFSVQEGLRYVLDPKVDRALAGAFNVPPLVSSGQTNLPKLYQYALDYTARALGEPGVLEYILDDMVGLMVMLRHAPALTFQPGKREALGFSLDDVWSASTWTRKFGARVTAADIVRWQSGWRLFGSVGSAVANFSQFATTTYPLLIAEGMNPLQAVKFATQVYKDTTTIWLSQVRNRSLTGRLAEEALDIQQSGVELMPAKSEAGLRGGWSDLVNDAPYRLGKPTASFLGEWAHHKGMFMFNSAEKLNRYATALAAIRRARARGMSREAGIEMARDLVRETQFLYDELALPQLFGALGLGPAFRVILQFKPFLFNFLSFEKDLILRAAQGAPQAKTQLAAHLGTLFLFGGLKGVMHHPVLSLLGGATYLAAKYDLFDAVFTPSAISARQRGARQQELSWDEIMAGHGGGGFWTPSGRLDDVLYYGIPGLLAGVSMGQRVGVSGQEFFYMMKEPRTWLGPHLSVYGELARTWANFAQQRGAGAGVAAGVLGAAGTTLVPSKAAQAFFRLPFARAWTGLLTASVLTHDSDLSFGDYLRNSDEGRSLAARGLPTLARNFARTFHLLSDGSIRDIDGKPMKIPYELREEELAYLLFGLPSIRQEEYSAAVGFMTGEQQTTVSTRRSYVESIARSYAAGDLERVYDLILRAKENGIDIPESAIQRELEAITEERLFTIQRRLSPQAREQLEP